MEKEFYYSKDGKQVGPFNLEKLASEQINAETLVWYEGMEDWKPAGQVPELANIVNKPSSQPNAATISNFTTGPNLAEKPKNYLVLAIMATLLCFWPVGIAAIVNATKVDKKFAVGDVEGAKKASDNAKKFTIISACAGIAVFAIYAVIYS